MPNIYDRYLPTGLLDMARDAYQKPSKFARGLLGPAYDTVRAIPEFLPGAGMYESKNFGKQAADQFRRNNYLTALGLLATGMATAGAELVPGGAFARGTAKTIRSGARQQPTMPSAMMREETGTGGDLPTPPPVPTESATRGILGTPDLRDLTSKDAVVAARSEPHLMQDKSGQYIGAPRGVKTRKQIEEMRKKFDAEVEKGMGGANWYTRARAFNREIAGPAADRQSLAASEEALWSAQANPDTNMGFMLLGHNAYEAGVPLSQVRTGAQARNYNQARAQGVNPRLGKKTGVYGQHLDPTRVEATTGTNDIWHARQFGYTNSDGSTFSRALSPQEHRFLDYETMLAVDRAQKRGMGGRKDWRASEIQAAPWVSGKGKAEAARRNLSEEEGVAIASKTYPDYGPKYTAYGTSEQVPGKSTGLLDDVQASSYPAKEKFSKKASWVDETGRDPIYSDLGMYVRRSDQGPGYYINSEGKPEINPATVSKPLVSYSKNKKGLLEIPQTDKAAMDAGEAVRGLLDMQEGAAWNKIITHDVKGTDRASLDINMGRLLNKKELAAANKVASKHGFGMANTENGVAFLDFKDRTFSEVGKLLKGGLANEINKALPGAEVLRGRLQSGYIDQAENLAKELEGSGRATKQMVSYLEKLKKVAPEYFEKILDSEGVSKKAQANLDRLIEYGGKGQRKDYEELLKIVSKGKLRGLLKRIASSGYRGLPVVGGAAVTSSFLARDDDTAPE
mgnify:CR=1 FL=1|tara:strand:+ start:701 stop:2911 length:2211 start_codon:yes stop_codon:yes gene_type:complete